MLLPFRQYRLITITEVNPTLDFDQQGGRYKRVTIRGLGYTYLPFIWAIRPATKDTYLPTFVIVIYIRVYIYGYIYI